MSDVIEKRLIEALESVEARGDVAPFHVHDPMTMPLRESSIQAHLMHWDDFRGRYALTGPSANCRSRSRSRHGRSVPKAQLIDGAVPPLNLRRLRSRNS
jgi:hypothetical protein